MTLIPALTESEKTSKAINSSKGEFLVIEKLKTIASERNWIVYRSLRLENHPTKIEGEIDIVIFTIFHGIILLEVKGSKLRVRDGSWSTFNRGKNSWENLIESPFEQMNSGYWAFKKETKELFQLHRINPLISWGCIFPESEGIDGGMSYPSWRYCSGAKTHDLENFIQVLAKKERNKLSNLERKQQTTLDFKLNWKILNMLAPIEGGNEEVKMELSESLISLEKETSYIRTLINAFASNQLILAEGAAGTGKTRSAIFECRRLNGLGLSFQLICLSTLLASNISKNLKKEIEINRNNKIRTIHKGIELQDDTDALIIDEAQDILHLIEIRDLILKYAENGRNIRIFADFDFQNLNGDRTETIEWLKTNNLDFATYRLNNNCRNTIDIAKRIQGIAKLDSGKFSVGSTNGLPMRFELNANNENVFDKVNSCIQDWTSQNYPENSITVLNYDRQYSIENESELIQSLNLEKYNSEIESYDQTGYCSIMEFKGMESPCVIILVNVLDENWETYMYTGISRAQLMCYIVFYENLNMTHFQELIRRCKI